MELFALKIIIRRKMKVGKFLISLVCGDLIGFNRYRNNVISHIGASTSTKGDLETYYRLQMILSKLNQGDNEFARKIMQTIEHKHDTSKSDRLNRYLKY